jgi:hypothetical protein
MRSAVRLFSHRRDLGLSPKNADRVDRVASTSGAKRRAAPRQVLTGTHHIADFAYSGKERFVSQLLSAGLGSGALSTPPT